MSNESCCRISMVGVGGQGVLLASIALGETLMKEGHNVVMSEIHGMAKRGGVVEITVVFGERESAVVDNGGADILVAFEPLEGYRALGKCSSHTIALVNTAPIIPPIAILGDVEYPEVGEMLEGMSRSVGGVISLDAVEIARQAGTKRAANIVMLGALSGTGYIPCSPTTLREVISSHLPEKLHAVNGTAFDLGADATGNPLPDLGVVDQDAGFRIRAGGIRE